MGHFVLNICNFHLRYRSFYVKLITVAFVSGSVFFKRRNKYQVIVLTHIEYWSDDHWETKRTVPCQTRIVPFTNRTLPCKSRNVPFTQRSVPCKMREVKIYARPVPKRPKNSTVPRNKRATSIYGITDQCRSMKMDIFADQIGSIVCLIFETGLNNVYFNFTVLLFFYY